MCPVFARCDNRGVCMPVCFRPCIFFLFRSHPSPVPSGFPGRKGPRTHSLQLLCFLPLPPNTAGVYSSSRINGIKITEMDQSRRNPGAWGAGVSSMLLKLVADFG